MSFPNAGPPGPTALVQRSSQIVAVEDLRSPAGALEAVLNTGYPDAPLCAVLCHPYPPAGGTLHNKVVYHAMKAVSLLGLPALRFNFRGVGRSAGRFEDGQGEQEDVRAAVDWTYERFATPVILIGFSFGAYVGLRATASDTRVVGRVGLGLPVRTAYRDYTYEFLSACPGPLLFVSGDQDEFSPAETLSSVLATIPARHRSVLVEGADHFFAGVPGSPHSKLPAMQLALDAWLQEEFPHINHA